MFLSSFGLWAQGECCGKTRMEFKCDSCKPKQSEEDVKWSEDGSKNQASHMM